MIALPSFDAARDRVDTLCYEHIQFAVAMTRLKELLASATPIERLDDDHEAKLTIDQAAPDFDFVDADALEVGDARGSCVLIVGESGTGKSNLISSFAQLPELRSIIGKGLQDFRPLVPLEMPDNPTPKAVITALHVALGGKPLSNWTRNEAFRELRNLLAGQRTRVVLFDEAHVVAEGKGRTEADVMRMARFFKFLLVTCKVMVVLAGEGPLEKLLDYGALRRRMVAPVRLRPYGWGEAEETNEFRTLVRKVEETIQLPEPSNLWDWDMAARLYYESRGVVGLMAKQVKEALRIAIRNGDTRLDFSHFADAWEDWEKKTVKVSSKPFEIRKSVRGYDAANPYACDQQGLEALWARRFDPKAPPATNGPAPRRRAGTRRTTKVKGFAEGAA